MYLKGSKWSMLKKRRPLRIGRILFILALIGGAVYVNAVIVPETPPLFVPTQTPTRAPETYIVDAEALALQGKFLQSIETYKEAIQADPRNATNFISLAKIQIYNQQYKDAQISAENALLINTNNPQANAIRGWALTLQDEYLLAEAAIKRALELDNNNALAHAFYAELLMRMVEADQGAIGAVEKAGEESKLALALAPDIMETHRARGIVFQNTSNYDLAVEEFKTAIQLNPNLPDLHLFLGLAYRSLDPPQYDNAVEEFTRANALNPADPLPDTYIARTYVTIGEYAKAIQYAEQAKNDAPTDPYMWGNLGTMYYRNRQYTDAVIPLKLAVRGGNVPDSGAVVEGLPLDYGRIAEYYYLYGLDLARVNDCNEAIQISQMLIQGVSNDETAVYNANEIINICQANLIGTATPELNSTPADEITETPTP
jgi:tetratricopeptide (TPR) repeat protein